GFRSVDASCPADIAPNSQSRRAIIKAPATPATGHDDGSGINASGERRPGGSSGGGCVGSTGGGSVLTGSAWAGGDAAVSACGSGAAGSDGTSVAGRSITVGGRRRLVPWEPGGFSFAMPAF